MEVNSIFAVDLDGTLLRSDGSFSSSDLKSLGDLRAEGCSVVLATGRSPFSLQRCLRGRELPVDWYVLSSGAGIMNSRGTIRLSHTLSSMDTLAVHEAFESLGIGDISIQGPFPEAHMLHWMQGAHGDDFNRRLEMYRGFSHRVDSAEMESSELIGFAEPEKAAGLIRDLEKILGPEFSIIRATSPIDHSTVWIEVFPRGVNKGAACEFIRRDLSVEKKYTGAVGNDWNDIHMLEWAGTAFAVENAPDQLTGKFISVASNDNSGVSEAVARWKEITA